MDIDLTGRDILQRWELFWLVTGIIAKIEEDRFAPIVIKGSRDVCNQIKLVTRLAGRHNPCEDLITLIEVSPPAAPIELKVLSSIVDSIAARYGC